MCVNRTSSGTVPREATAVIASKAKQSSSHSKIAAPFGLAMTGWKIGAPFGLAMTGFLGVIARPTGPWQSQ